MSVVSGRYLCWVAVLAAALLSFSLILHRYAGAEGPNVSHISEESIVKICKVLQYQKSSGHLTEQVTEDWENYECSRHMGTATEKQAAVGSNRTAELDVALRKERDRQRSEGIKGVSGAKTSQPALTGGKSLGSADASVTPKAAPASKGSGAPGNSPGAWMDGLKRQVQKELGRGIADTKSTASSGTSVPKTGTQPEKTPYVSPFSTEAERKKREQLYAALDKELQQYKKENAGKLPPKKPPKGAKSKEAKSSPKRSPEKVGKAESKAVNV